MMGLIIVGENPPEWTIGLPESCMKELVQIRKQASMAPEKFGERRPVAIEYMIYAGSDQVSPQDAQWFAQNLKKFDNNPYDTGHGTSPL